MISASREPSASVVAQLAAIGRFAASRGWVPATSGNFSVRVDEGHAAVTRSGVEKGALTAADIAVLGIDEPIPAGMSAETPLHLARYRTDACVGAVVHVHTIAATVLSRLDARHGVVRLAGFEMHKSIAGFTTHESTIGVPIVENDQDTLRLAALVEERVDASVPAYLLAGHGLYTWGATLDDARRHLEGIEFLLACALEERRLSR